MILAQSATSDAIDSAVIAAAVSLLVAVVSAFGSGFRDSRSRRYERRRTALLNAQDAALTLRERVRDYGAISRANAGQPSPELSEAERHLDESRAALDVAISRVGDPLVVSAVEEWQSAAQISFISVEDVTASAEQARWDAMNLSIGQALQSKTGLAK